MNFVRVNGAVLHFRYRSVPARPAIVFVNSLGTDFRIWDEVVRLLGPDFATVVYDKRGHGLSELGSAPTSITTHAADLAALLEHLAVKRATICGLSIGGLIAQGLYEARPDLVERLVLCDTAAKIGTPEVWDARIAAIGANGVAGIADEILRKWFTADFHHHRPEELAGYRAMLARQDPAGYAAACAAIRDADFTSALGRIAAPTLCVVGDQDGSTPPALVESMAAMIPGARFEIVANAGHIPCVEQPGEFTGTIRAFIAETRGSTE